MGVAPSHSKMPRAPWTPVGFILDGEDWTPGDVAFIFHTDGQGVTIDDLRIAAAARELLGAAKRALNTLKAQGEGVRPGNVLGALEAAIAKATGDE